MLLMDNVRSNAILEKWGKELLSEKFVPFPKKLIRILPCLIGGEIAIEEFVLLLALIDYKRDSSTSVPENSYLSRVSGLSEESVVQTLDSLRDKRFLRIGKPGISTEIDYSMFLDFCSREVERFDSGKGS